MAIFSADMPARCVVGGCSNSTSEDISLHKFPKDEKLSRIWTKKVQLTRAKWSGPSARSVICSAHFDESDFETALHWKFGMKRARKLKANAIPTQIKLGNPPKEAEKRRRETSEKREKK